MMTAASRRTALISALIALAFVAGYLGIQAGNASPGEREDVAHRSQHVRQNARQTAKAQIEMLSPSGERTLLATKDAASKVRWELVSYASTEGPCLDAFGVSLVTGETVDLSGCGSPDGPFHWSVGGAELDGTWFNVYYGTVPTGASRMVVHLNGEPDLTALVSNGVWLVALPGDSLSTSAEPRSIEAQTRDGRSVETVNVPSLVEKRRTARESASAHSRGL